MAVLKGRRWIILIGLTIFFLAALLFPMRLAFDWVDLEYKGVSARSIDGTIWDGQAKDLSLGGLRLGDVDLETRFLPLLTATLKVAISKPEDTAGTQSQIGVAGISGGGLTLENINLVSDMDAGESPVSLEAIEFKGFNLIFNGGKCRSASGQMRLRLRPNPLGIDAPSGMLGNASCEDDALLIPFSSQSGTEKLRMKIFADGKYKARLILTQVGVAQESALKLAGFRKNGTAFEAHFTGAL